MGNVLATRLSRRQEIQRGTTAVTRNRKHNSKYAQKRQDKKDNMLCFSEPASDNSTRYPREQERQEGVIADRLNNPAMHERMQGTHPTATRAIQACNHKPRTPWIKRRPGWVQMP